MEFNENVESVETQEVADLAETTEELESVEEQEVAEPVSTKTDADSAFAEMRRRNAELERQLAETQKRAQESEDALGLYFQGDNKIAQAIAHYEEKPIEVVEAELKYKAEYESLKAENERFKEQMLVSKAEMQMKSDLEAVQKLNPNIKSIDELGSTFTDLRLKAGLSVEDAYFAIEAKKAKLESKPAEPIGKVNSKSAPKDFLSREEVKANENNKEWVKENYDLIRKSMPKW